MHTVEHFDPCNAALGRFGHDQHGIEFDHFWDETRAADVGGADFEYGVYLAALSVDDVLVKII